MPLSITDEKELFDTVSPATVRFMFTCEDADTVSSVLDRYFANRETDGCADVILSDEYTRGHIKRGVK